MKLLSFDDFDLEELEMQILHDADFRNRPESVQLRLKHGPGGYGIFWMLIEMFRQTPDGRLMFDLQMISFVVGEPIGTLEAPIQTMFQVGLLSRDGMFFCSPLVSEQLQKIREISEKRQQAGKKGGQHKKTKIDHDTICNLPFPPTIDTPQIRKAWIAFVEMRRAKGQPYKTRVGPEQAIKKLAEMGHERAFNALNNSIANEYQGIFEPKMAGTRPQLFKSAAERKREHEAQVVADFIARGEHKNEKNGNSSTSNSFSGPVATSNGHTPARGAVGSHVGELKRISARSEGGIDLLTIGLGEGLATETMRSVGGGRKAEGEKSASPAPAIANVSTSGADNGRAAKIARKNNDSEGL